MAQENITYDELVTRYGKDMAFDILLTIEKAAGVKDCPVDMIEEDRLQRALAQLDQQKVA